MGQLENSYKSKLIKRIETRIPGSYAIHQDAALFQGIPDLLILYRDRWAMLEVKKGLKAGRRPNQSDWGDIFNSMSFCAFIYPEVEEEVLYAMEQSLGVHR